MQDALAARLAKRCQGQFLTSYHVAQIVCDAILPVLWNGPGTGVMRHADAGYEVAVCEGVGIEAKQGSECTFIWRTL